MIDPPGRTQAHERNLGYFTSLYTRVHVRRSVAPRRQWQVHPHVLTACCCSGARAALTRLGSLFYSPSSSTSHPWPSARLTRARARRVCILPFALNAYTQLMSHSMPTACATALEPRWSRSSRPRLLPLPPTHSTTCAPRALRPGRRWLTFTPAGTNSAIAALPHRLYLALLPISYPGSPCSLRCLQP
eukprot:scaffold80480_cov37-Tisochrysis_lutea.AAC.3